MMLKINQFHFTFHFTSSRTLLRVEGSSQNAFLFFISSCNKDTKDTGVGNADFGLIFVTTAKLFCDPLCIPLMIGLVLFGLG